MKLASRGSSLSRASLFHSHCCSCQLLPQLLNASKLQPKALVQHHACKLLPATAAHTPCDCLLLPCRSQLLLNAKTQLEALVAEKLDTAIAARDHAAVLRFVALHKPLAAPDKGVRRCACGALCGAVRACVALH